MLLESLILGHLKGDDDPLRNVSLSGKDRTSKGINTKETLLSEHSKSRGYSHALALAMTLRKACHGPNARPIVGPISDVPKTPRRAKPRHLHPVYPTAPSPAHSTRPPAASTMPALAHTSRAIARTWTQHSLPVARAGCSAMQSRNLSEVHSTSSFDSPFKGKGSSTKIPSFGAYKTSSRSEDGPKLVQYFMVGTMGALASLGAKATVQGNYLTTPS